MNAIAIGMRVLADPDAVRDRPVEAGRQQDVGAGEMIAHQIGATIAQCRFDMP